MGTHDDEELIPALVDGAMIPMTLSEAMALTSWVVYPWSCGMEASRVKLGCSFLTLYRSNHLLMRRTHSEAVICPHQVHPSSLSFD